MRRLIGWTAGVVGVAALARALARHRSPHAPAAPVDAPPVDDHAETLRRKLDETRIAEETTAPQPEPPAAVEPTESLEERRARVHAKAQEAIDAMKEPLG